MVTGLIGFTLFGLLTLENCTQNEKAPGNAPAQPQFAGSQACVRCHAAIYEQHLQSFHHLTTAPANSQTLKGDFDSANRFFLNDYVFIAAEKRGDSFYQTAYANGVPKLSRPFDIIVGSGKRGQTSIYWFQDYLFELPLTYFTETNEWTISPGYSRNAGFNRPITSRCLECHSTYFQETTTTASKADEFSKTDFMLGVECEKCHGSGLEHIAFHENNPDAKTGHAIFNPGKATRQQSLDLCRLCHGGRLSKSRPSFTYQPGDKLFDFFRQDTGKPVAEMDVHGNQYGMLAASKCFMNSEMTCLTCHDAHKNESMQTMQFFAKCETCHSNDLHNTCKLASTVNQAFLRNNCINCHMPEEASKAIMVIRNGQSIPTSAHMRSHYIAIYKDISNRILSAQK